VSEVNVDSSSKNKRNPENMINEATTNLIDDRRRRALAAARRVAPRHVRGIVRGTVVVWCVCVCVFVLDVNYYIFKKKKRFHVFKFSSTRTR
jgi:hypothetical protein